MHDDNLMDKVKDGFEKTGEKMKEGFEKAKDFAGDAANNIKEKFKEGTEKLSDMKDDTIDAAATPGEMLNEQLCESLEGTDDENKMKIQNEFCKKDFDNEHIVVEEKYEEYTEILPDDENKINKKDAA